MRGKIMATKKKKVSPKKRRKAKIVIFIIEIIVLLIVLAALYVSLKLAKLDSGNKIGDKELETNDLTQETEEKLEGYTTIALFGLDNRSNGNLSQGNSDVIIIASINNKTKEVKMASIFRDTYLNLTDNDGYNKANAAYSHGGYKQAVNMLNVNWDLKIEDYVTVDFNAVSTAVDLLGGVEIEITDAEADYMKGYMDEVGELVGKDSEYLYGGGTYNLDGVQATAYARIRQTAGDDFKRTERQRLVIEKMVEKALSSDLATINKLVDELFPEIKTSFTSGELLLLAKDAFSYSLGENTGFPVDRGTKVMGKAGDCVIPLDLANNVKQLHEFLFESEEYEVSSSVQKISNEIVEKTGMSMSDIP